MTTLATSQSGTARSRRMRFRYGAVFMLVLALVLFEVIAPDTSWGRAIDVALAGAAVAVSVGTSRARGRIRRARAAVVAAIALLFVVGIGSGLFGTAVTFLVVTALVASIPLSLRGGLMRLVREAGVTIQVVAGALTIYLIAGLLFASIIGFVATVESGPYFKQGPNVSNSKRVYYSFTVLTTTGFGDYTAAQPVGHALAVLEMLTGQLYLVTVIGVVVGNFASRRRSGDAEAHRPDRDLEAR